MKILVIQEEGESRDNLVSFLESKGAQVIATRPSWPGFFHTAKDERPDVAVVDCSPDPGYGIECAGYLGETGFTNLIKVIAVNVAPQHTTRLKRRAPKARIVSLDNLEEALMQIDPSFGDTE